MSNHPNRAPRFGHLGSVLSSSAYAYQRSVPLLLAYRPNLRPSEHWLLALSRLRDLHGQLDRQTIRLLEAVVIDALTWCELGKRLRVHAFTAKRKAIDAVRRLAQAW